MTICIYYTRTHTYTTTTTVYYGISISISTIKLRYIRTKEPLILCIIEALRPTMNEDNELRNSCLVKHASALYYNKSRESIRVYYVTTIITDHCYTSLLGIPILSSLMVVRVPHHQNPHNRPHWPIPFVSIHLELPK